MSTAIRCVGGGPRAADTARDEAAVKLIDVVTTACASVMLCVGLAAVPVSVSESPDDTPALAASAPLRASSQVTAGERVRVQGRVPVRFARGKVTLLRREGGALAKVAAGRADARGRYDLAATAPVAAGTYTHEVRITRSGDTRTVKRFAVTVAAATPSPTPPTPTPVPTGPQGDPNDWTYLGGTRVARWDPCHTITWSVTGTAPYAASLADLQTAFARIGAATGLGFAQVSDPAVSTFDITWTNAAAEPRLAGSVVGLGGFTSYAQLAGPSEIASGYVLLDQEHTLPGGFATVGSSWGKVLMHEMSHAVGLGHAAGIEQIMYPSVVPTPAEFGAGDLTGLTAVGATQGCFADSVLGRSGAPASTRTYVD